MAQPVMFILTGISFAGKSVLACAVSQRLSIEIVDPDRVSHEMGLGRNGEFLSDSQWRTIHKEAERQARVLLRSNNSLVYDTTSFTREQRDELRALAISESAIPVVIFVNTPREEARKRWAHNNMAKDRFAVHEEDFNMVAEEFEEPSPEELHLQLNFGDDVATWIEDIVVPIYNAHL